MRRTYNTGLVVLLALIIFIIFGSLYSIKAFSKEKAYFSTATDEAESLYVTELKEVLKENEIYRAGITMTKKTLDGLEIDYEVSIHTSDYIYDHISDWDKLTNELNKVTLKVDNSKVAFSFD